MCICISLQNINDTVFVCPFFFPTSVLLLGLYTQTFIYLDVILDLSTDSRYWGTQCIPHSLPSQHYESSKISVFSL